jgi:DNA-binding transcriptional ArsR family regulator
MEAGREGKRLGQVVDSLAAGLDLLAADLAAVRRAHRLPHADTLRDVLLLGGLHGMGAGDLELLFARGERTRTLAADLEASADGGDAAARDAAAEALFELWGIAGDAPRLALFAPWGAAPDLDEAARRAARAFREAAGVDAAAEGARARVARTAALHAAGNGTVRAVLEAAAGALDLEPDLEANRAEKDEARPAPTAAPRGTPGRTTWGYVVVARSLTRSDPAFSAPVFTARGPAALSDTDAVRVEWEPVPGAMDYLVLRTIAGGTPGEVGLVTPEPLGPETTHFLDTGAPATAPLPPPQDDDGFFHSRDLYWHSTFVRDRVRLVRRVDPEPPPRAVVFDGDIGSDALAEGVGATLAGVLAKLVALEEAGGGVDATLDAGTAREAAMRLGGGGLGVEESAAALAERLGVPRRRVYAALAEAEAAGFIPRLSFERVPAEVVAAEFGFAVVAPRRVPVGPGATAADVARLLGIPPAQVEARLPGAARPGAELHTPLSEREGRALVEALGRTPVREGVVRMRESIPVAELAGALGVRPSEALRQLRVLDAPAAGPGARLDAATAARVARWRAFAVDQELPVRPELLGIEENPLRREGGEPRDWRSGETFPVLRRGFGRAMLRVSVTGVGPHTVGPMVVNRDEGHGIAWAGTVPDGQTLVFGEDGHARLDGADVTSRAWAWKGACFAGSDDDPLRPRDWVFAGPGAPAKRAATFAAATPVGAFAPGFTFPHAGHPVPMPGVGLGKTRFAFFTQEAHFAGADRAVEPPRPLPPVPRIEAGFADESVFHPGAAGARPVAARVALSWLEHEAYAVRVLVPARFRGLFDDGDETLRRVRRALERHRPAGIYVRVEYLEDRWILGGGALTTGSDPLLDLRGGTTVWPRPDTP